MSKARQSRKRVVLRRAAKRRARYEGGQAILVSAEPPAYLRWAWAAEDASEAPTDRAAKGRDLVEA